MPAMKSCRSDFGGGTPTILNPGLHGDHDRTGGQLERLVRLEKVGGQLEEVSDPVG